MSYGRFALYMLIVVVLATVGVFVTTWLDAHDAQVIDSRVTALQLEATLGDCVSTGAKQKLYIIELQNRIADLEKEVKTGEDKTSAAGASAGGTTNDESGTTTTR